MYVLSTGSDVGVFGGGGFGPPHGVWYTWGKGGTGHLAAFARSALPLHALPQLFKAEVASDSPPKPDPGYARSRAPPYQAKLTDYPAGAKFVSDSGWSLTDTRGH